MMTTRYDTCSASILLPKITYLGMRTERRTKLDGDSRLPTYEMYVE
jgi:hypothetical protein